jgi:hypothetical protein
VRNLFGEAERIAAREAAHLISSGAGATAGTDSTQCWASIGNPDSQGC